VPLQPSTPLSASATASGATVAFIEAVAEAIAAAVLDAQTERVPFEDRAVPGAPCWQLRYQGRSTPEGYVGEAMLKVPGGQRYRNQAAAIKWLEENGSGPCCGF